ncbi:unnamed protein product [Rhizophagus irregularis]|uniref:MIR domain-containing protein n=1 Tax=Rhizophagus irregularis TaxID=588596 RepID=A0A2N1P4F9_9GLOM|nr:hypothetical protein RhiirC2_185942 [Rhizophagus irregularis]CAB4390740.1 unnamed protein product [Rhizophagus irregularis]CAB5369034.1 unnamed protein product [Rhizophagus irregularis]
MNITRYYATVHPEEWVNQVQTICLFNNIKQQEKDILKICKLNIDLQISIPNEINTLKELVKALKTHSTFEIYKSGCKYILDQMRFQGDDATKFLADFRSLCFKAEITNPQEIKNRLLETYSSNEFFKREFSKKISSFTPIDEIYVLCSEVISESSRVVIDDT